MKGTVKWFNETKGYGFIVGDDEHDYFVHINDLGHNVRLFEGTAVDFEVVETEKGNKAVNVTLIE